MSCRATMFHWQMVDSIRGLYTESSPAPPKPAGQTAGQQQQRKASISDKVIGMSLRCLTLRPFGDMALFRMAGTAEAFAGRVTKNQGMIERGQARKGV